MNKITILIALLLSFNSAAYQTSLVVSLFTAHTNQGDREFNNKNYSLGLMVEYEKSSYSITAIGENSYYNPSVYVNASYKKQVSRNLNFFAGVTAATGYYEQTGHNIMAGLLLPLNGKG